MKSKIVVLIALLVLAGLGLPQRTLAATAATGGTLTVNTTADNNQSDSVLSLREAMLISNGGTSPGGLARLMTDGEKNQLVGCVSIGSPNHWSIQSGCGAGLVDTIQFNISGAGAHTLALQSNLPATTDSIIINGFSQPGSLPNTKSKHADNAVRNIVIDAKNHVGLTISGGNSTIRGLEIKNFDSHGLQVDTLGGNAILGNKIHSGKVESTAVILKDGSLNHVGGGTADVNVLFGDSIENQGVYLWASSDFNTIENNLIGTDSSGKHAGGNTNVGIVVNGSQFNLIQNNVVAFTDYGIGVWYGGTNNIFHANAIFANRAMGIDLGYDGVTKNDKGTPPDQDTGDNNKQNFPILKSVTPTGVSGILYSTPNVTFTVEFFVNPNCGAPHGYGQGKKYLTSLTTVTTDANGRAHFTLVHKLKAGRGITATATDNAGNTSEFSKCKVVK